MKFKDKNQLLKYINNNYSDKKITGMTSLVSQGLLDFNPRMNFNLNFLDKDKKDIIESFDDIENSLLFFIFKEKNLKINFDNIEEIFELLSLYFFKIKSFEKLKKVVNSENFMSEYEGLNKEVLLKLMDEVREKYE